jgi:hypothetical protein
VAGWIQTDFGWTTVCIAMMPFLALVAGAVLWLKYTPGAVPEGVTGGTPARSVAAAE